MANDPVPAEYVHRPKIAAPGAELLAGGTRFKWYDLRFEDYPLSDALVRESRERIVSEVDAKRVDFGSTMGFVILHIAGGESTVAMLIVSTWRNSNEIWETVYLKDLLKDGAYERYERGGHLPTFCVWELGIVGHERDAFERYLRSKRDAAAAEAYFRDRFAGRV